MDQSPAPEYDVEEASIFISQLGVKMRPRTISRHCELEEGACRKEITLRGFKYKVPQDFLEKLAADTKRFDSQKPVNASINKIEHEQASSILHDQEPASIGELEKLQAKNFRLTIEKEESDRKFDQITQKLIEAGKYMNQIETEKKQLEEQLKQLNAPQ